MASKHERVVETSLPFSPLSKARAVLRSGTVYAIDGGDSYIYYGQIAVDQSVGFFKYRSKSLSSTEDVLSSAFMSRFHVSSIGAALRAGTWLKLGLCSLREELEKEQLVVMWPLFNLEANVWKGHDVVRTTMIHDPEIQNLEIMAVYDAVEHVPGRLIADFRGGFDTWLVGGLVWRERVQKEEAARQYPDLPWCVLPEGWVHTERAT